MKKMTECDCGLEQWFSEKLFRALGDPNRIALLARLAQREGESTVSEVASCCAVDFSVVSRHLKTLRDAGVVSSEKRGKEVYYRVRFDELIHILRGLADALESCCGSKPKRKKGVKT